MFKIIRKSLVVGMILLTAVMQYGAVSAYAAEATSADKRTDIQTYDVEISEKYFYDDHKPTVRLYKGDAELTEGEDYMVAMYSSEGSGKAYIKGINKYRGTIEKTFEIKTLAETICAYATTDEFLGIPYVWGGTTKKGFDCSGFVQYVYNHFDVSIPRTTWDQCKVGTNVGSIDSLKPGDLVFFNGYEHVGMFIGGGKFVQSCNGGVMISSFYGDSRDGDYWGNAFCDATRIL